MADAGGGAVRRCTDPRFSPCRAGDHDPSSLAILGDEVGAVCTICGAELTSSLSWDAVFDEVARCDDCGEALPWCECERLGVST